MQSVTRGTVESFFSAEKYTSRTGKFVHFGNIPPVEDFEDFLTYGRAGAIRSEYEFRAGVGWRAWYLYRVAAPRQGPGAGIGERGRQNSPLTARQMTGSVLMFSRIPTRISANMFIDFFGRVSNFRMLVTFPELIPDFCMQ